jgi:hypothetical protein
MTYGNRYTATIEDDRDHLQELKGTLAHWQTITRKYAEETRDPYAFVQYVNLEHMLGGSLAAVEHTLSLVMEEREAEMADRFSRLHKDMCSKSTVFGSPC